MMLFLPGAVASAATIASGNFTATGGLDAVGGVYTIAGSPVALADLIDPDNSSGFSLTDNIDAGGIKLINNAGIGIVFADPLRTTLLSGFSLVLVMDTTVGVAGIDVYDSDFSASTTLYNGFDYADLAAHGGAPDQSYPALALVAGVNTIRTTFDSTHMAVSVNGSAASPFAHPGIVGTSTYPMFSFAQLGADGRVRSFAFYEPVPDADLPAL